MKSQHLVVPDRVEARVLTKVAMGPKSLDIDTPCHLSTYSTASHDYAQIGWVENGERIVTLCHIVIWVATHGPIQFGWTVDHRCHTRRCIRLDHLRLLPNEANAQRNRPGLDWDLDGSCANGHGPEHRYVIRHIDQRRKTRCRRCMADANERWQRKKQLTA
jgi:hypothetical protein